MFVLITYIVAILEWNVFGLCGAAFDSQFSARLLTSPDFFCQLAVNIYELHIARTQLYVQQTQPHI